ncbi:MAG TPA: hypothetical protein VMF06_15170 [Candidatus Limnocylindria bacterium]|jgi:hypothetical protein|nr:hypothetical protein [Candidatus Limnocylindria bacterium]
MRFAFALGILAVTASTLWGADKPGYSQDFSSTPVGEVPSDMIVSDGQFAVKDDNGNKLIELPGSPLESFGLVFGPNEAAGVEIQAMIRGTKTGRKFPTFAAGLNGISGYKLRVAPAKNAIELAKGDEIKASVPFTWKSGEWVKLKLQVVKADGGVTLQGRAWQGTEEPKEWAISFTDKEPLKAGKASVWGMPYSGTPIQFDDLKVSAVQ